MILSMTNSKYSLPKHATFLFNHCNVTSDVIAGLTYNQHPVPLLLDGVSELHKNLFKILSGIDEADQRHEVFEKYMNAHFQLNNLSEMGQSDDLAFNRKKINYKRIILGWHLNPNGLEAAVLKRWVESRFGLSPRFHIHKIRNHEDPAYQDFLIEAAVGMYNTNAIEAQLDVLYSYTQYELSLLSETHLSLYRGFNLLNDHEVIDKNRKKLILLLNNINSFSKTEEVAENFGDYVISVCAPRYKVFCFSKILPQQLNVEAEYMVLGGLYEATLI